MDVAGTLDEVPDDVKNAYGLSEGEPVIGIVDNHGHYGGYSEYVVLPAASVTRQTVGTTFAEAASFLMNALTARCVLDVPAESMRRGRADARGRSPARRTGSPSFLTVARAGDCRHGEEVRASGGAAFAG